MFGSSGHRFSVFRFAWEQMRWLGHQRCSQAGSAQHVQHAFQVVDHRRQADLGLRPDKAVISLL
jgi:hypothetical protein